LINTQIASSNSLTSGWKLLPSDALPQPGSWTISPNVEVLTPDINQSDDGTFAIYYINIPKAVYSRV
jgi:hypothetical protein